MQHHIYARSRHRGRRGPLRRRDADQELAEALVRWCEPPEGVRREAPSGPGRADRDLEEWAGGHGDEFLSQTLAGKWVNA